MERNHDNDASRRPDPGRLTAAAILLGIGLNGLWDGIVLHQIRPRAS